MYNWSVDEKRFKKSDPEGYRLWRLTQLINYGLDGEKLDREEIAAAWPKIRNRLDPYKARYLEFLLWGKQYSLPTNISFWNLSAISRK
jgi:hypothetical protein